MIPSTILCSISASFQKEFKRSVYNGRYMSKLKNKNVALSKIYKRG